MPPEQSSPAADLDPATYARGHRLFEESSDQRARIVGWLAERLRRSQRRGERGLSVLSVGCGDGTVDAALAAGVSGPGWAWTCVDPHEPSVERLLARFAELPTGSPPVRGLACRYDDLPPGASYDVVVFVHSLYYVDDLAATLRDASSRLRPGGELLVLHAPLGDLNRLAARFAPPVAGHAQPWSEEVERVLAGLPVDVEATDLAATVDLTAADEADPALLEFVVQSPLDDAGRADALAGLRAISASGPGLRVPHPVTAYCVRPR